MKALWKNIQVMVKILCGRPLPRSLPLPNGWEARWVYRDNFILSQGARSYEIYVEPGLTRNERILRIGDMPRNWLPPNDQEALTEDDIVELQELTRRVVEIGGERLTLVDSGEK